MTIIIIAAIASNGVIGREGKIPWHISEDLKRFKRLTIGHTVIMGRRTYQSIGKPLPDRTNIVLTRSQGLTMPGGVVVCASLADALDLCRQHNETEAYITGGTMLYREALPIADELRLTHVHHAIEGDTVFPPYDPAGWIQTWREDYGEYSFADYRRASR